MFRARATLVLNYLRQRVMTQLSRVRLEGLNGMALELQIEFRRKFQNSSVGEMAQR